MIHFTSALAAATDQVALLYPSKNRHGNEATIDPEHNYPLWHYYNNNTHKYQCGDDIKETIQCHEDKTVSIKACYCITMNDNMEQLLAETIQTQQEKFPLYKCFNSCSLGLS